MRRAETRISDVRLDVAGHTAGMSAAPIRAALRHRPRRGVAALHPVSRSCVRRPARSVGRPRAVCRRCGRDARQPRGSRHAGHRGRGWQALLRLSRYSERERRATGCKEYRRPAPSKRLTQACDAGREQIAALCAVGRPAPAMVTARRSEEAWQTPASVSGTRARLLVAVTRPGAPNRKNTGDTRGRCARWRRSAAVHRRCPPRPAGPTAARRRHRTPAAVRSASGCGTGSRPGASTDTAGRRRWRRRAWPPARG